MSTIDENQAATPSQTKPSDTVAAMRLGAPPPRVTRISRKVLAGLGVAVGIGVGGALIFAFQVPDRQPVQDELFTTERRQTADGLQDLPRDYSAIPQLGPALPGDLGMPIVNAREDGRAIPAQPLPVPQTDPEEQRRIAEQEAARTSEIFFQSRSSTTAAQPALPAPGATPSRSSAADQNPHMSFLNAQANWRTVAPDRVQHPASPYLLQAGSVIPAALITGIRSDLPGQITAQVTQNVYDSPTGAILLIPQGTRIVGEYDNDVSFGQRRVLLVWHRLIFPGGRSIILERLPGADGAGYAGLEDGVDFHWWELAKAAGLSTLLSIGAELAVSDDDPLSRAVREGAIGAVTGAGQQIIERQLQIAPILTVRPGFPLRIIVTRDLVIEP